MNVFRVSNIRYILQNFNAMFLTKASKVEVGKGFIKAKSNSSSSTDLSTTTSSAPRIGQMKQYKLVKTS